jgi:hypothetical protein
MNCYELNYLHILGCKSLQEFYISLSLIAKAEMGLEELPFPLSALEHPHKNIICPEIHCFIWKAFGLICEHNPETEAIRLIKFLKENHVKESYENPVLPDGECTTRQVNFIHHIFTNGIDLPASKHNHYGIMQNYSGFFIDMYFGNYTEFMDHIKSMNKEELRKELKRREGYCQYSTIFAPVLGIKMVKLDTNIFLTKGEKKEIKQIYYGRNENRHVDILKYLLEIGADPNAVDIHGHTALQHAIFWRHEEIIATLLKYGTDPNIVNIYGLEPLSALSTSTADRELRIIDMLISHNAKCKHKVDANDLRSNVESYGTKELAIRLREALPREANECEKCMKHAIKKCSACGLVFYCTITCQKIDWVFHKATCRKSKQ